MTELPQLTPEEALEAGFRLGRDMATLLDGREAVRWATKHDLSPKIAEAINLGNWQHRIHFARSRETAIVELKAMLREMCSAT